MAGCDGRSLKSTCVVWIFVYLFVICLPGASSRKKYEPKFKDIPSNLLKKQLQASRHLPLCLVLRESASTGSKLEDIVYKLWLQKDDGAHKLYSDWQFGSFSFEKYQIFPDAKPTKFPELRCYLGETSRHRYSRKLKFHLVEEWFGDLSRKQAEQLEDGTMESVSFAEEKFDFVLVAFPDIVRHTEIEELAFKHCEEIESCKAFIVHEHAADVRTLQERYSVMQIPAIVIIHKKQLNESGPSKRIVKVLDRAHLTDVKMRVYLYAWQMSAPHYTSEMLEMSLSGSEVPPLLLVIYSAYGKYVMGHLNSFQRSIEEFQELGLHVNYGLIDLSEVEGRKALNTWINYMKIKKYPCTVLLYKDDAGRLQQSVLRKEEYPSPLSVHAFVNTAVGFTDITGQPIFYQPFAIIDPHQITPLYEGPLGYMCSSWSHNETNNTPPPKPKQEPKKRKKKEKKKWHDMFGTEKIDKKLHKINGIPLINSIYWSEIIEKSHAPLHPLQGGKLWAGEVTKVALVIFIIEDCGSCRNSMETFKELKKSVRFIEGGSAYLVNCTAEANLCKQHRISGYPTITAFRGLGWLHGAQCVSPQSQDIYHNYVRLNYHGILTVKSIMEWFTNAAAPAVRDKLFDWPDPQTMDLDVGLFGVLTPRYSSYLPLTPNRKMDYFYSYQCFRLACERMYGKVNCFSVYSRIIPPREFDKEDIDAVVTEVILKRKDGATAVVMEMGINLEKTLDDMSDSQLHSFHKSHRYNLRPGQRCEHDHALCTDLITTYTLDHSRMPVTHITDDVFHIEQSMVSDEDLPVLLALVHPDNITRGSHFMQMLTSVASELYNELVVFTVRVDQFPAWTGHFIPDGYRRTMIKDPSDYDPQKLFVYPRLCFIRRHDHERAAFYPPLGKKNNKDWFTADQILLYAKKFLIDPDKLMIQTEHF